MIPASLNVFRCHDRSRLREVQVGHEIADAALAVEQQRDDVDADLVGERVEELRGALESMRVAVGMENI